MSAFVIARLRTRARTRRRKPRPPWWWVAVGMCALSGAVIAWATVRLLGGRPGDLFMVVCNGASFRWWWRWVVADTEKRPPMHPFPNLLFWSLWSMGVVVDATVGSIA